MSAVRADILIVDDERKICEILREILEAEGYRIHTALNGTSALRILAEHDVGLILLDIKLPDIDGITLLKKLRKIRPHVSVVMISAFGTVALAVDALKNGADDFIEKPLETNRVLITIRNTLEKTELRRQSKALKDELLGEYQIIGTSPAVKKVSELTATMAPTSSAVLILGESGTGKELVARNIHIMSARAGKPFIKVNCAALPGTLIESELFGYEKGAFTDAVHRKPGQFEAAHTGTLFLDEIGDMSLQAQAKVLRAIEENEIVRLGSTRPTKIDVRLIAATNQNLKALIEQRLFREDLYYRINVLSITVPPLRERREDIPALADFFLRTACIDNNRPVKTISAEAMDFLVNQPYPGNVRELKHLMEKAAILHQGEILGLPDVGNLVAGPGPAPEKRDLSRMDDARGDFEREHIIASLNKTGWHISRTARLLGIDRSTLFRKMSRLGIKHRTSRPG